jgi:large subunit ribosomal protein L28
MARVCQLTGKRFQVGNNVSHSKRRTKRRFYPNLVTKKFFIPETEEWVVLKVSTSALKTINKIGISAALRRAEKDGFIEF